VRLVACSNCHAQYDVTNVIVDEFPCRCGSMVKNCEHEGIDIAVMRCSSCGAMLLDSKSNSCAYCRAAIVREDADRSLICPECYARNTHSSRFCVGCGVGFHPDPLQLQSEQYPCPACSVLMPTNSIGGIVVNECPRCQGLWVPGSHFDLLINRAIEARKQNFAVQTGIAQPRVSGANPARQKVEYRKCPMCDQYMRRQNYRKRSGIIIDRCVDHGVWLDADELEQIAGFVLSGGLLESSPVIEEKAQAEARAELAFQQVLATEQREWGKPNRERGLLGFLVDVLQEIVEKK